MSHISGIETVYYQTANMEESVQFYTEVLGLTLKNRYGIDLAEYEIDGGFDLSVIGELARKPEQGGATVMFVTGDIEALRDALSGANAKFDPIDDTGGARMINFEDPDKNKLMAVELPAGA